MLPDLLQGLPSDRAFAIYGVAPNWVSAALAAHTDPQPFSLYSQRETVCWTWPIPIQPANDNTSILDIRPEPYSDMTVLNVAIPGGYLDYFQPEPIPFPLVDMRKGLLISGPLPQWLVTGLVRFYKGQGLPWIALFEPRYSQGVINRGVIVYSQVPSLQLVGQPSIGLPYRNGLSGSCRTVSMATYLQVDPT